MARKPKQTTGAAVPAAVPTPMVQPTGGGPQPTTLTPEQMAQRQAQQQRARTEVAILKQRFAETDVALTIATAERDQLIQQLQASQQTIEQLTASLAEALKKDKKGDGKDAEPETKES